MARTLKDTRISKIMPSPLKQLQMSKQITKKARDYLLASTFLKDMKKNGVTYKNLKCVLFGEHAVAFIAAVRKHGQSAFNDLKKAHQFMYMVEVAIEECIKKQTDDTDNG